MGLDPKDNEVLQLLKKLKDANGTYPQELLAVRRQGYLKQVAEISGGAGLAMALKNTAKTGAGKGAALPPSIGTLLETLLVVAIVAEASTVAYFYRDKIAEFFRNESKSPVVQEIANPPILDSSTPTFIYTPSAMVTETDAVTVTPTATAVTPFGSPTLMAGQPTDQPASGTGTGSGTDGGSQAVSTPDPSDPNGNNGNHYGQTPIPHRTKDPGNDNDDNNSDSNQDDKSDPKKKK